MRYGGENRPAYLRGRHLDRLARDLGVKPALVRRRAISLRERTKAAAEEARRSLPAEFQDRPILDRVIEVLGERGEALTRRAAEAGTPVDKLPVEKPGIATPKSAADAIAKGFSTLGDDLDLTGGLFRGATTDVETQSERASSVDFVTRGEQLANELEEPAERIKRHGREIYDAVVEFNASVDRVLVTIENKDGLDSVDAELLEALAGMVETADRSLHDLNELYSAISEMEQVGPVFRASVRNMRAGLHDILDARTIILEWKQRAKALGPASE
jgi:hypothetical protein